MSNKIHSSSIDSKTILIIGGSGFLGSHVSDAVSRVSSFAVVVASRKPNPYQKSNATWVRCDITKPHEAAQLIESVKPTAIIHTATPGRFAMLGEQAEHYEATKNLLEAAKTNNSGTEESGLQEKDAVFHTFS